MQRPHLKKSTFFLVSLVISGFCLFGNQAQATTVNYYVDPLGTDDGAHGTGTGTDAWATIQYAITNVANPSSDTIIINISGDTYTTNNTTINIDRNFTDLTLQGAGAQSTIIQPHTSSSSASVRNINIGSSENVTLKDLTVRYGRSDSGAGITASSGGSLILENCIIDDNDSNSYLSMRNGGIASFGNLTILNSTISNNNGDYVGGVYANGGITIITNSTFYNNTGRYGGNIGVGGTNMIVTNTTITKGGSGIAMFRSDFTGLYIQNSIIYGADSGYSLDMDGYTSRVHGSNNIIRNQDSTYFTNGVNGNFVGTDLIVNLSDSLSNNATTNGTKNVALSAGSIAIDAGSSSSHGPEGNQVTPPASDQRGKSRYNETYDIGAFEYQGGDEADPLISSASIHENDEYIDVTFNEGIYSTDGGSGAVETSDFALTFTQGTGDATGANITSVSQIDNQALSGGETTIRLYISITGTSRGVETIAVGPADGASFYDAVGNPMDSVQITNTVTLHGAFQYYVRADGNDENNGSANDADHAWLTIQHAISTVSYPTTAPIIIYISGDTYTTSNTTISIDRNFTNLTLQGAGAQSTIIQPHSDPASATVRNITIGSYENVTFKDLTVRYGRSDTGAGITASTYGSLTLENCIIDDNDSNSAYSMRNGGIVASGDLTITNSTVSNNDGDYVGGVYADGGTTIITNSTFYNNTGRYGGNVGVGGTNMIVTNTTITKGGDGISMFRSDFDGLYVENSIIYGADSGYSLDMDGYTSRVHGSNNIIKNQDGSYFTNGVNGNQVGTDLGVNLAESLALNGSVNGTPTIAISEGSVAINTGTTSANNGVSIPPLDQRGASRLGVPDIGSYEYGGTVSAPVISTLYPADNATGVSVSSNLVLTFNKIVDRETGNIVIKKTSDNSTVETIVVTSGQVTGTGTTTITVNPNTTLDGSTEYYIQIDDTAFDDVSSNSFAGISDTVTWSFTTADTTSPTVSSFSPTDNATNVAIDANLVITFDEIVDRENGNIVIKKTSDNSIVETIGVTSGQVTGTGTTTITINPSSNFASETEYYVQIDDTAFDDTSGNSFAGISNTTSWSFTSADVTAPVISTVASTPADTGSTITWTTNEESSSQVEYGLTTAYGNLTTETDTTTRVISHSVALTGLTSCATYHYRTKGRDLSGNTGTGSDNTFTTTGCVGSAPVLTETTQTITKALGGTFQLTTGTANLDLIVPVNFEASASAEFQLHQITTADVISSVGAPTGKNVLGNHTYSLLALTDVNTTITNFDNPLTLSVTYTDDEVAGLLESTLEIHRWDGANWSALNNCSVSEATNVVTCETTHFSTFGVFGSVAFTGGGGGITCNNKASLRSFTPSVPFNTFSFLVAPRTTSSLWSNENLAKEQISIFVEENEVPKENIILKPAQEAYSFNGIVSLPFEVQTTGKISVTFVTKGTPDKESCKTTQVFFVEIPEQTESETTSQENEDTEEVIQEQDEAEMYASAPISIPHIPDFITNPAVEFLDTKGHWAESYIRELRIRGIVEGKESGIFDPDSKISRAEFVKMALLAFSIPVNEEITAQTFLDVSPQDWFNSYVAIAKKSDIVKGYPDGSFKGNKSISRAEALKVILETSGLDIKYEIKNIFSDILKNSWYEKYVLFAIENDLIDSEKEKVFFPDKPITRAEVAKALVKTWQLLK